ncbi:MAG: LacI family transcriptional regulator [Acidobacteriota bacterium]|nr:LacI family transcriptional regulator [Acidobacteriota bacterium]
MTPRLSKPYDPPISLKQLAEHLNLSPATVSLVVNNARGIRTIALPTRARVLAAAKQFNYRPNSLARSLRTRQTFTIGVIVPELSEGYFTMVMNAVESYFLQAGYLHFVVCHQGQPDLIEEYPRLLLNRFVDGLLLVNTALHHPVNVPVVSISGHEKMQGVTNIVLDHDRSATLALEHLYKLGHRRIAFMRGQRHASDSQSRWESTMLLAKNIGIEVFPDLCIYLEANSWSPELGYLPTKQLLERTTDFTALFSFNDTAAMGAIRAIADAGLSVPGDISVVGFDDISNAAYHLPSLTTVRQPLRQMGEMAAQLLIKRILNHSEAYPDSVYFDPELVVRESTAAVSTTKKKPKKKTRS